MPPQVRWRIYGIDLPDNILRKVYYENAARLLRI
jgi:predicted TIM-barrel fold metal-dependent hydrolase